MIAKKAARYLLAITICIVCFGSSIFASSNDNPNAEKLKALKKTQATEEKLGEYYDSLDTGSAQDIAVGVSTEDIIAAYSNSTYRINIQESGFYHIDLGLTEDADLFVETYDESLEYVDWGSMVYLQGNADYYIYLDNYYQDTDTQVNICVQKVQPTMYELGSDLVADGVMQDGEVHMYEFSVGEEALYEIYGCDFILLDENFNRIECDYECSLSPDEIYYIAVADKGYSAEEYWYDVIVENVDDWYDDDYEYTDVEPQGNDYIEYAVNEYDGKFTIGTREGTSNPNDDNKKMLFGHPYPGTSFTTINLDGEYAKYTPDAESSISSGTTNMSEQTMGDVSVKQVLSIVKNSATQKEDVVQIKYIVTNNDGASHDVGVRIMMDTMLGDNDSAPFKVPNVGNVLYEREYTGADVPVYWQAFDSIENPTIVSQGTLRDGYNTAPDKVQFASWGDITDTLWDYEVSEYQEIGDSSVAVYWNPITIGPGARKDFVTYYGLSEFSANAASGMVLGVTAPSELVLDKEEYTPDPFIVTAYIVNSGEETSANTVVKINLPEGLNLYSGSSEVNVGDVLPGEEKLVSWYVTAVKRETEDTLAYSVELSSDGVAGAFEQKHITVPSVSAIKFADPGLEQAIRDALGQSEGAITKTDLESITALNAENLEISDLSGIEYLVNLEELKLNYNNIDDLNLVVDNLQNLERLELRGNNIENIFISFFMQNSVVLAQERLGATLGKLPNLSYLDLSENNINNIEGIENFTNIETLNLSANKIDDIANLAGLSGMKSLNISGNQVEDITPLLEVKTLESVKLQDNPVVEIPSEISEIINVKSLGKKTGITSNKVWRVQFSKGLDEMLNYNNYVTVKDSLGNIVDVDVTYSKNEKALLVTPKSSYSAGETYSIVIGEGILSEKGETLPEAVRMVFTVAQ
ncbi:hypothetical protein EAL2_c20530 [Peptoclostridium acidaminophilum DSM 3953]|uniref:SbsA Ig-like domain-containing protein n=1 Tax=Peptoclostridium acidaminophilum DSM 3953 TaxID=1286171 RepID=W8T6F7_PEPAC|nr:leucine-rich repeat domain-containing protein [Peptoclostridium acidaminophilum]AHM57334.1 hypothetical protein EAL2_c20530 [Peptoclostridium acidaminophilum DSM 3953]